MNNSSLLLGIAASGFLLAGTALAQTVVQNGASGQSTTGVSASPSVDNGVANGVAKPTGSPSVSNGVSNGVVKQKGAPSVGDGVGNGVMKSTTTQQ